MRHELKYKLDHFSFHSIVQAIRNHPAGFRKIFPDRKVNNIYFDTPSLRTYSDNVIGIADRKKFRVRWYGEQGEEVRKPMLEVKIKQNYLGTKDIYSLDGFVLQDLSELTVRVTKVLGGLNALRPTLMNSYLRSYYGTTDEKFRITVDRNMTYSSLIAHTPKLMRPMTDQGHILELKYEKEQDGDTDRITQFLPFRQTKSSKYVTGITLTN